MEVATAIPYLSSEQRDEFQVYCEHLVNLSATEQFDEYRMCFQQFEQFCNSILDNENEEDAFIFEILGDMALEEHQPLVYYEKALSLAHRLDGPSRSLLLSVGRFYCNIGDRDNAIRYFQLALKISCGHAEQDEVFKELSSVASSLES